MPTATTQKWSLAKIATILGIISALGSMTYAYVVWHFDTFVYQDKMVQYQADMAKRIDALSEDLGTKSSINYLEIIIILKQNELRELDQKIDAGETLTAEEIRRQESLVDSIASFKQERNKLIGLPEGLQ